MSFFSRIFRNRSARKKSKAQNYDYLPLFFWDKSLSNMAKIIMCLVCGGNANREKTMNKLRSVFNPNTVNSIEEAITQLEKYGYMSSESYLGPYGEPRIDKRLCNCPNTRLPKLVEPTGAPLYPLTTAVEMYDKARDLGFITESGKDTTYFLYDALRIFTAVENILEEGEKVILPLIGPETHRHRLENQELLLEYPCSIITVVITTTRLIIVQEDCSAAGRQAGMARFIIKSFDELDTISLNEKIGRLTFEDKDKNYWDGIHQVDIPDIFALERMKDYFSQAHSFLPPDSKLPQLTYVREDKIHN